MHKHITVPETLLATRYITPLREGGSLPGIVEANNEGTYVVKFRGAGQGAKALIAEWIVGELARYLGLPVPEIVYIELDAVLGRAEPDPEIQELIQRSAGLNLALDYLPGSISFDPLDHAMLNTELASGIVWLDAFATNIDRTARNTNMLVWHKKLWLIDHGAAIYFHHNWKDYMQRSQLPFAAIKDHVLLPFAHNLHETHQRYQSLLTADILKEILSHIPESWLIEAPFESPAAHRQAYLDYFLSRLAHPQFVEAAYEAQQNL